MVGDATAEPVALEHALGKLETSEILDFLHEFSVVGVAQWLAFSLLLNDLLRVIAEEAYILGIFDNLGGILAVVFVDFLQVVVELVERYFLPGTVLVAGEFRMMQLIPVPGKHPTTLPLQRDQEKID